LQQVKFEFASYLVLVVKQCQFPMWRTAKSKQCLSYSLLGHSECFQNVGIYYISGLGSVYPSTLSAENIQP